MILHPSCVVRRSSLLGFSLATGLMISPLDVARSQSIVTDGDIVGDGISLQALKDSHCDHLETLHAGSALPVFCALPAGTRFVFVTSTGSTAGGNMVAWANSLISPQTPYTDGLIAADAICQHHADNATSPLPGTYKAWLSTSTVDAKDRIGDHKWVLLNNTVIADNLTDLLDCTSGDCLQNPINQDENEYFATGFPLTGTDPTGAVRPNYTCLDWTFELLYGSTGDAYSKDAGWTDVSTGTCIAGTPTLYCFGN